MPLNVKKLLYLYRKELEAVSDGHMKRIILYGSYARGDFKPDSDVDVMILLDLADSELRSYEKKICDITYDFNMEHETDIMPVVQNFDHFNYWKNAYMFYHNIETEEVAI